MSKFLTLTTSIFLISCGAINNFAGLGVVKDQKSDFDNSRSVTVSPNFLGSPSITKLCYLKMGLLWNEKSPKTAKLILSYDSSSGSGKSYTTFQTLGVNIDGNINYFTPSWTDLSHSRYNTVSRSIATNSTATVNVPLSYIQKMVHGNDVRIIANGFNTGLFHKETNSGAPLAKKNFKEALNLINP